MHRRTFLFFGAAGAIGIWKPSLWQRTVRASGQDPARPEAAQDNKVPYGQTVLGLSDDGRDGTLYVPKSYKPGTPMPLVMMLHGFSGWGDGQRALFTLA